MYKYLITLLFIIFATPSYAQTYQYTPIPTNNATWKMTGVFYDSRSWSNGDLCYGWQYSFTGRDSTSLGQTYHQMEMQYSRRSMDDFSGKSCFNSYNQPLQALDRSTFWMIEKDKKIYLLDSIPSDTSNIWNTYRYDFNAEKIGDRIGRYGPDTIIAIDTININGTLRRRIVADRLFYGEKDTLIEGVGSIHFGLDFLDARASFMGPRTNPYVTWPYLVCYTANNTTEYVRDNSACMDMWPVSVSSVINEEEHAVAYPNPFVEELTIEANKGSAVYVYNIQGMKMTEDKVDAGEKVKINTANWANGMYFFTIKNGDQTITGKLQKL